MPGSPFGVYVHFPWCLQKCPYCDFLSVPTERAQIPHARYADAVIAELERRVTLVADRPLGSIFFGGGTPSLWAPAELARVLAAILRAFPQRAGEPEITVECNPSSFDARVAAALREAGVNRISLGVQSFDAQRLAFLGRLHDADGASAAVRAALDAGFPRVSGDLIFGVAGQTPAEAASEARRLAELGVSHLSAYALTIEPGTVFGEAHRRGRLPILGEELVADSFLAVRAELESLGFRHYEISNYARPGDEARHNLGYWRGQRYLGLGTGAWGTVDGPDGAFRYRTTPSLERYFGIASASAAELVTVSPYVPVVEPLAAETRMSERLMLGLRLAEGVDLELAARDTGAPAWTPERRRAVEKWQRRGALQLDGSRLSLHRDHWLLADGILGELI